MFFRVDILEKLHGIGHEYKRAIILYDFCMSFFGA